MVSLFGRGFESLQLHIKKEGVPARYPLFLDGANRFEPE